MRDAVAARMKTERAAPTHLPVTTLARGGDGGAFGSRRRSSRLGEQIFVAFAIGQHVEDVADLAADARSAAGARNRPDSRRPAAV